MEAETKKTQKLKQSVVVMGNARREVTKATVSIEEVKSCGGRWWWWR